MWGLRAAMSRRSVWRHLQFDALRLRLIKFAARVVELKTMIRIQWPTAPHTRRSSRWRSTGFPRLIT